MRDVEGGGSSLTRRPSYVRKPRHGTTLFKFQQERFPRSTRDNRYPAFLERLLNTLEYVRASVASDAAAAAVAAAGAAAAAANSKGGDEGDSTDTDVEMEDGSPDGTKASPDADGMIKSEGSERDPTPTAFPAPSGAGGPRSVCFHPQSIATVRSRIQEKVEQKEWRIWLAEPLWTKFHELKDACTPPGTTHAEFVELMLDLVSCDAGGVCHGIQEHLLVSRETLASQHSPMPESHAGSVSDRDAESDVPRTVSPISPDQFLASLGTELGLSQISENGTLSQLDDKATGDWSLSAALGDSGMEGIEGDQSSLPPFPATSFLASPDAVLPLTVPQSTKVEEEWKWTDESSQRELHRSMSTSGMHVDPSLQYPAGSTAPSVSESRTLPRVHRTHSNGGSFRRRATENSREPYKRDGSLRRRPSVSSVASSIDTSRPQLQNLGTAPSPALTPVGYSGVLGSDALAPGVNAMPMEDMLHEFALGIPNSMITTHPSLDRPATSRPNGLSRSMSMRVTTATTQPSLFATQHRLDHTLPRAPHYTSPPMPFGFSPSPTPFDQIPPPPTGAQIFPPHALQQQPSDPTAQTDFRLKKEYELHEILRQQSEELERLKRQHEQQKMILEMQAKQLEEQRRLREERERDEMAARQASFHHQNQQYQASPTSLMGGVNGHVHLHHQHPHYHHQTSNGGMLPSHVPTTVQIPLVPVSAMASPSLHQQQQQQQQQQGMFSPQGTGSPTSPESVQSGSSGKSGMKFFKTWKFSTKVFGKKE
ncbi:hypothetical protein HK097_005376 [Rhizophlyctis rosea]|uniref:Uncharacterized protein n=1 Tax=Rhizophlyctis rosea TaxID=64517 RepID=A0AAD5S0B1_9FUNG|nr:hypothetical protein HK097_005376 [Rhizophlyctis rosea]